MELDDLDRPPVTVGVAPEPSVDAFIVRLAATLGGTMVLLVLLSIAFPHTGAALALLGGLVGGYLTLRGQVPQRAEGYLLVAGLLLAGAVLIPS